MGEFRFEKAGRCLQEVTEGTLYDKKKKIGLDLYIIYTCIYNIYVLLKQTFLQQRKL